MQRFHGLEKNPNQGPMLADRRKYFRTKSWLFLQFVQVFSVGVLIITVHYLRVYLKAPDFQKLAILRPSVLDMAHPS